MRKSSQQCSGYQNYMFKDLNGNMFSVSRSSVPLEISSAIFRSPFLVLFSVIECPNIHLVKDKKY